MPHQRTARGHQRSLPGSSLHQSQRVPERCQFHHHDLPDRRSDRRLKRKGNSISDVEEPFSLNNGTHPGFSGDTAGLRMAGRISEVSSIGRGGSQNGATRRRASLIMQDSSSEKISVYRLMRHPNIGRIEVR